MDGLVDVEVCPFPQAQLLLLLPVEVFVKLMASGEHPLNVAVV